MISTDVGHLVADCSIPLDLGRLDAAEKETAILDAATEGVQQLVKELFSLPTEPAEVGRLATLPEPETLLPREKPIPKQKPQTKWEQFRQERGIQKRKRERLVFDENEQDWKPRYGSNRSNNEQDQWVIEHNETKHADVDPFTKMTKEKKERVKKNKAKQVRNLLQAAGERVPGTIDLASAVENAKPSKNKRTVKKGDHVKAALRLSQQSTASMGQFDKRHKNEPAPRAPRTASTHLSSTYDVESRNVDLSKEKDHSLKVLSRVVDAPRVNAGRAANLYKRKKETENAKAKKTKAKK